MLNHKTFMHIQLGAWRYVKNHFKQIFTLEGINL